MDWTFPDKTLFTNQSWSHGSSPISVLTNFLLHLKLFTFILQVKNGKLHYTSDAGIAGKVERNIPEMYVADGRWHTLLMEKNGSTTSLSLDQAHSRDIHHITQDFGGLNVLTIQIGGVLPGQTSQSTQNGKYFV